MAVEWGGILSYCTQQRVLDTWGLTDADIAKAGFPKTKWGRSITGAYLTSRRPDVVVLCARIFPTRAAALRSVRPNEARADSYFMSLTSRELGYRVAVQRLGPEAYWPSLVPRD